MRYAPLPRHARLQSYGYGAGGRETPGEPNLLRLLVGEEEAARELTRLNPLRSLKQ